MTPVPDHPKIYHITHLDNLAAMVTALGMWSDAQRVKQGLLTSGVGMQHIKRRRLEELVVACHRPLKVGDFVPFYFCPRSVMLFILHRGNHPDLEYRGGQRPIIHLCSDLERTIRWAEAHDVKWAFSDRNAGARYTGFYKTRFELEKINWQAVNALDFRDPAIRDAKQAEFLLNDFFPFGLIEKIGVHNVANARTVEAILAGTSYSPAVTVEPSWYY